MPCDRPPANTLEDAGRPGALLQNGMAVVGSPSDRALFEDVDAVAEEVVLVQVARPQLVLLGDDELGSQEEQSSDGLARRIGVVVS